MPATAPRVPERPRVRWLGLVDYRETWDAMRAFTDSRDAASTDEIWLLQHPPVFTQGQAGRAEHLLLPGDIPVVQSDRGGQVTYHGPGQLVAYLLLDIRRRRMGIRDLVDLIEQSIVALLEGYGIAGQSRRDAPGVYVGEAKIAALGLRVRRGCSYHGLSLNVEMDLEPFSRINPCGYEGMAVTSLGDCLGGQPPSMEEVGESLLQELFRRLDES